METDAVALSADREAAALAVHPVGKHLERAPVPPTFYKLRVVLVERRGPADDDDVSAQGAGARR